jgi:UDP-glucuronate decarboxylase
MKSRSRGNLPSSDLQEILTHTRTSLAEVSTARILICGGSGFIGTWLTSALLEANAELKLNLEILLITRNIENAKKSLMPLSSDPIKFLNGDLSSQEDPFRNLRGSFSHIIHAATPTILSNNKHDQEKSYRSTVLGSSRLVDFALRMITPPILLHTSSGAVYGSQPIELENIPEGWENDNLRDGITSYGLAKLEAEKVLSQANFSGVLKATNPRLFTFFGPKLPLDAKYAIGNFMADGLNRNEILIKGHPNTRRSYMYPTDLIEWIIKCLINPSLNPLHIGSDEGIYMKDLASQLAQKLGGKTVGDGDSTIAKSNYVPGNMQTKITLGVTQRVTLEDGVNRWINWLRQ